MLITQKFAVQLKKSDLRLEQNESKEQQKYSKMRQLS